jgi:integrase
MAKKVRETHQHPKYPRLRLDLRDDSAFWQARTFLDGKQRQKSTETANLRTAFKLAEEWYWRELRASVQFGRQHPVEQLTADPVVGEVYRSYLKDTPAAKRPEIEKRWGPIHAFWQAVRISDVNAKTFREFYKWRQKYATRTDTIKPHTLHKDVTVIRQILKYAIENDLLEALPAIPKVGKIESNPRPWLTPDQLQHLIAVSEARIEEVAGNDRLLRQRRDLHDQILFMVHSMCRVGEMLNLRFSDCRYEQPEEGSRAILIADVKGKRAWRTFVAPPEAAAVVKGRSEHKAGEGDKADHVFPSHHQEAFTALLKAAKLYTDSQGFTRNMKSLRATAISLRVVQPGANLLMIARNAGTSIAIIDSHYAKRLTAEAHKGELGKSVVRERKTNRAKEAELQALVEQLNRTADHPEEKLPVG